MNEVPCRCSTLGQASRLTRKHQTRLERLARDKLSSLLRRSVNYGQKKFYNIGPWVNSGHGMMMNRSNSIRFFRSDGQVKRSVKAERNLRIRFQVFSSKTRDHIFSCVRPFYERAVSNLDPQRSMHLPVQVTHSSFIEGSHTTKNMASVGRQTFGRQPKQEKCLIAELAKN